MRWQWIVAGLMVFILWADYDVYINDCGTCCPDMHVLYTWNNGTVLSVLGQIWLVVLILLIFWGIAKIGEVED